jgi:hypothetical protein
MDPGEVAQTDPVDILLSGMVRAIRRLFSPDVNALSLAADVYDNLLPRVNELIGSDRWRLLSHPPHDSVLSIHQLLVHLHSVQAQLYYGGEDARADFRRTARKSKAQNSLPRCASIAQERADQRLDKTLQLLTDKLSEKGIAARIVRRQPAKRSGLVWPFDEVILLVDLESVVDWSIVQAHLVAARIELIEPVRTVSAAPVRDDRVITSLAGSMQSQFYPTPDSLAGWTPDEPLSLLAENASSEYWQAVESLVEMSAVLGGASDGQLHQMELAVVRDVAEKFNQLCGHLQALSSRDESGLLDESIEFLSGLADQVQEQLEAFKAGHNSPPKLALAFLAPMKNQVNETVNTAGLIRLALLEYDVEPDGAKERVNLAIQRLVGPT